MIHIHYDKGPASLADVSVEEFNQICRFIKDGMKDEEILQCTKLSAQAISDIRSIKSSKLRRCCFCGKLFITDSPRKTNCGDDHYLPCIDCGVPVKVSESYSSYMKAGGRRCKICRGNQIGLTRSSKSKEEKDAIIAKQQKTMIKRYGAATPLQVPEMKARIQDTVKQKYGVANLSQSKQIQDKIKRNSQEKYGVDHYSNNPEIRNRMLDGMVAKYGVKFAQQNSNIQEKTKQTNLIKYGCTNVFQSEIVRQHFVDNHTKKYGVGWPNQRIENVTNPLKYANYLKFLANPEDYIATSYNYKPTVTELAYDLGLDSTTVGEKLTSLNLRYMITDNEYSMEADVINFLKSLNPSIVIDKHNRDILNGLEIDIYLPDFLLGIECNPTATHNSSFNDPWGGPPKHYKYHNNKTELALSKGVMLYHIFGYEWSNRREVIKSQLTNLIGANQFKLFGRNTFVKEVSASDAAEFLNDNHRQGSAVSSVRLGLYDKQTANLVSLMTFGKMRTGIGKKVNQGCNDYELIRFCNLTNTSVVGAASKLFKHFVQMWCPTKVVSFSDRAHTKGNLYHTLSFKEVSISSPGYVWVNMSSDKYLNRVSCQKSNLVRLFDDVTKEDISAKSEKTIMEEHGYAQVFDSGVIRWEWTS